jgi:lysyl-tRNA synthetase class 2
VNRDNQYLYRNLHTRGLVLKAVREFFSTRDFLEVETPVRCPGIIPEAHIDPVKSEGWFLQASPELCMKRLLSKGFKRIFQICRCFRRQERGIRHLPELTLLEWYSAGQTWFDLMDQCQDLIRFTASRLNMHNRLQYQGYDINLDSPWKKLTISRAFDMFADKSIEAALTDGDFDEILSFQIEPHLGYDIPVFLTDYPAQLASLARLNPEDSTCAQRFELYIAGIELANAFTELNDPTEQELRFKKENHLRILQGKPALPMPVKFLKDLETMPDAAGIAMGIDRLVMLFCDTPSIDDVVAFTPENL